MKYNIKKDSEVIVIAGDHKGKRGKILKIVRESQMVFVEGINLRKKHLKKTQENPSGSIIEKEMPIHYSNVMAVTKLKSRKNKSVALEENKVSI